MKTILQKGGLFSDATIYKLCEIISKLEIGSEMT
jgi:hypothetical protein